MKTFAEYLPTMTERERDIVMAYERAMVYARDADPNTATPFELLLATPPAKEPVSVTGEISTKIVLHAGHLCAFVPCIRFDEGDLVRVVNIEEVQR